MNFGATLGLGQFAPIPFATKVWLFQKTEVNRLTDSLDNYGQPAEAAAQGDSNRSQEAYVIVHG